MKRKNIFFLTALSLLVNFASCKKEEPQISLKDLPKCTIFGLEEGNVYCPGETVILSFEVEKGKEDIKYINFFINDKRPPYPFFNYNSLKKYISFRVPEECKDSVTLKIEVIDKKNNTAESTLKIPVVDERPDIESPDIVSFKDGICPNAFKLYGWGLSYQFAGYLSKMIGYDDDFSLQDYYWLGYETFHHIQTTKTFTADINLVEYYSCGDVQLSINGKDQEVFAKGKDEWTKNYYYLPAGTHTFCWYSYATIKGNIDAVRFINNIQSPDYVPEKEFPYMPESWQSKGSVSINHSYYPTIDNDYICIQMNGNSEVSTAKTCTTEKNVIEYYASGPIDFYIDGELKSSIGYERDNMWIKHRFHCEPGTHHYKWVAKQTAFIDAIRFTGGLGAGMPY